MYCKRRTTECLQSTPPPTILTIQVQIGGGCFMKEKQEVVTIKLEGQMQEKRALPAKIGIKIKAEMHDIFIYNGASQYLVQTVLKELMAHDT